MKKKYCVIGAGILGASTAYHLAKAGEEVVIMDRKDKGQATDAAAGIVCPWLSQRRNKAWYRLAKNGARYYPELMTDLQKDGEEHTGYARVGAISLHHDHEKLLAMKERALKRREEAPEIGEVKILTPEETKKRFPPLLEGLGSVFVSGAARVDGRALRDALIRSAKRYGATFIQGDAKLLHHDRQKTSVQVNEHEIIPEKIIITAGAWADELLKPLGIQFNVYFQKAQIVHLHLPHTKTDTWPVVMPPSDQYILAFQDRIIAGATHENNVGFDHRMTASGIHEVLGKALHYAPGLADSTVLEVRVGFRPFTPGFLPIIGPIPQYNEILVANGLGASGLTVGPYLGSELAKLALDREMEIDLADYDVENAIE
ncbi:D-amino-acid dehydrogenase [Oikeobacillus pervagus]|uniref:D-amino-acid dehydrogenase n=1 Tax=Oikeobacillus pervagus TaxID=1325931 RepID=A0AAJ1T0R1_9BACI|nr:FAD-dependent oxidoreductase [Oikeobacillus pervagus]MDQ0216134.1 D-amino-acid dehydrogenase [Oikeobacillus pervagus]